MILEFGAGEERFEAHTQRQFMTESTNINSLADHHIWSTIKTLPATLPEPSSMDRGSRTGGTGGVILSALEFVEGGRAAGRGGGAWIANLG